MPRHTSQEQLRNNNSEYEFPPRVSLFATDFSTACDNAWSYALAIASEYRSKLLLAHVIDPNLFAAVPSGLADAAKEQVRREKQVELERLQQSIGNSYLDFEVLLREGEIADVLLRIIQERDVKLLITGTRGYSRTERLLLGSVAEKLFRQAHCPVLVVPERARLSETLIIHRILCPIDFSPDSPSALAFATSVARHHTAQLILMHVLDEDVTGTNAEKQIVHDAEHRLRGLLDVNQSLPFECRMEIVAGVPAEQISRTAAEYHADLVILSVHAASGTVAHERERTAYKTIRWSPCPVLTIPRSRSMADSIP